MAGKTEKLLQNLVQNMDELMKDMEKKHEDTKTLAREIERLMDKVVPEVGVLAAAVAFMRGAETLKMDVNDINKALHCARLVIGLEKLQERTNARKD